MEAALQVSRQWFLSTASDVNRYRPLYTYIRSMNIRILFMKGT